MYEEHFGLSGKPFQLNPDPDFFFGSRGHKRARAYLEYGLHKGEGFIVITGEIGAGKTTLLQGLLRHLKSDSIVAAQIVSTQLEADDLLRVVANAFGVVGNDGTEKSHLLVRLQSHLTTIHAAGKRALLVVDEAQNLSPRAVEELRMLSNFQVGTQSLVQSFLVGQPEFRAVLHRPEMQQLKQRVIASYHLGPLDALETAHYIEHRLKHVGWRSEPGFDSEAYAEIHALTGGIPRRINALCDLLLLGACLSDKQQISVNDVRETSREMDDGPVASPAPPSPTRDASAPNADTPHSIAVDADSLVGLSRRIEAVEAAQTVTTGLLRNLLAALRSRTEP